jgi:hypothetical protein
VKYGGPLASTDVAIMSKVHRTERKWLHSYNYCSLVLALNLLLYANLGDMSELTDHCTSNKLFAFLGTFLLHCFKKGNSVVSFYFPKSYGY